MMRNLFELFYLSVFELQLGNLALRQLFMPWCPTAVVEKMKKPFTRDVGDDNKIYFFLYNNKLIETTQHLYLLIIVNCVSAFSPECLLLYIYCKRGYLCQPFFQLVGIMHDLHDPLMPLCTREYEVFYLQNLQQKIVL